MEELLIHGRLFVSVQQNIMIDLERTWYEYQGLLTLISQFTSDSPFKPDPEKYNEVLEKYLISYIQYQLTWDHIVNNYVPEKYIHRNLTGSFELSGFFVEG